MSACRVKLYRKHDQQTLLRMLSERGSERDEKNAALRAAGRRVPIYQRDQVGDEIAAAIALHIRDNKERDEITSLLTDWLAFAKNIRPGCAAAEEWLDALRQRSDSVLSELSRGAAP